MFSDVFFTPILINDLIEVMTELILAGATGVFHVAGGERLSKYAFALHLAEGFDFSSDTIRAISVDDFQFRAKRPKDMSLSSKKTEQYLGARMPAVKDGLIRLRELEARGYRARVEAAINKGLSSKILQ